MRLLALLLVLCLASGPGWAQAGASGEPRPPALILADLVNLQKKREAELATLKGELLRLQTALEKSEAALVQSQASLSDLATATTDLTTFSRSLAEALNTKTAESETWKLFSVAGLSAGAVGLALALVAVLIR